MAGVKLLQLDQQKSGVVVRGLIRWAGELPHRQHNRSQVHPAALVGEILAPVWPYMKAGIFHSETLQSFLARVLADGIVGYHQRFNECNGIWRFRNLCGIFRIVSRMVAIGPPPDTEFNKHSQEQLGSFAVPTDFKNFKPFDQMAEFDPESVSFGVELRVITINQARGTCPDADIINGQRVDCPLQLLVQLGSSPVPAMPLSVPM